MTDKRAPWMKFYGADWRANPELRMCSLAARGLWIEMLCLAHEAEPYGHVLVAGRVPTAAQIAMQVAALPREVEKLLAELESANVFDRSAAGAIVSRRMVRDREKAERDAQNGKGGGNPRLKAGVNPPVKATVDGGDKAQMPDARCQMPDKPPTGSARKAAPKILLPSDWTPHAEHRAKAAALQVDCDLEAEKMRHWADSGGARCQNWDARFFNWLIKAAEFGNGRQQNHRVGTAPGRGKPAISAGWLAGAVSAIEDLQGGGVAD